MSKFREIVRTQAKFHYQFYFTNWYSQVFHMDFKIWFPHLVWLEKISFEKIVKAVPQKFATQYIITSEEILSAYKSI